MDTRGILETTHKLPDSTVQKDTLLAACTHQIKLVKQIYQISKIKCASEPYVPLEKVLQILDPGPEYSL